MQTRLASTLGLCLTLVAAAPACAQAPADGAGQYLTAADGTRIYYEVYGDGAPVVLLHGFIVDSQSWKATVLFEELLRAGFQVITLDLRGNGQSDKPHQVEAYENDAEARDVMVLVESLSLPSYCVVGYSRGAIIASRVLVLDARVACAVLGGMGADFTDPAWPRRQLFYEALSGKPVKELEGMVQSVTEKGLDRRALALMQQAQPSTTPEAFARVDRPVLVIAGTEDQDNGSAEELAGLIPASTYAAVPGKHGDTVRSEPFARAVVAFLKQHAKGASR